MTAALDDPSHPASADAGPIDILQLGPWLAEEMRAALPAPFRVRSLFDTPKGPAREALLAQAGPSVRALLCHSGGLRTNAALLARLPRLELIVNLGAGTDSVDEEAVRARGIEMVWSAGVNAVDVAELAMGMVLALGRDLRNGDRHVRAGRWPSGRAPTMHRVSGKRMGILGLGAIGRELARRAAAFDMPIAYHSRRPVPDVPWRYLPDARQLALESDYLVSALPGGEATHHLIDAAVLDALGPDGWLVSVGRGSVVDEQALVRALAGGRIAGAALDVFEQEPQVPRGLIDSDRTLLAPHRGGSTVEAYHAIAERATRTLYAHFGLA